MLSTIVIIVICLLLILTMGYMIYLTKRIKKAEESLEEAVEDYEGITRMYNCVVNYFEDKRKLMNGWMHKIDIMDRDIRKLREKLSEKRSEKFDEI